MDAGHELTGAERLGEVVVGADGQADDEVGLGIAGREHQHRDRALALDLAAHVEAVETREHEVEHHQVGLELAAALHARGAVGGDGDREALAAQTGGHGLCDRRLVLDHDDRAREGGSRCGHARSSVRSPSARVVPELWRFGADRP